MKLRSLELTNYRRFKRVIIDFPEGVIGIIGMNGVGKSTIIEAVSWALYGNETRIVRTSKEDLKRFGANTSDECAVTLTFELDGDNYMVSRRMKGASYQTKAEVTINGKSAATSPKTVTALIEKQLAMDYQAFYTSVFAKQKELNALSILDPSKRKKLVLRMLNIDSIEDAIRSVRSDNRELATRMDEIRSSLIDQDGVQKVERCATQQAEHEEMVRNITEELQDMALHHEALKEELNKLEDERIKQGKLRNEHDRIYNELTKCKTNLESTTKHLDKLHIDLESIHKQEAELKKLAPQIKKWNKIKQQKTELDRAHEDFIRADGLKKQLEKAKEQQNEHESQLKSHRDELKKYKGLVDEIEKVQTKIEKCNIELDEHKKKLAELRSQDGQLENDINTLKEKLNEIRKLGPDSSCPTCERPLREHYGFLEDKFQSELDGQLTKRPKLKASLKETVKQKEDSEKHIEALKGRDKHLHDESAKLARLDEAIKSAERALEQDKSQMTEFESGLDKYKGLRFDAGEHDRVKAVYLELEKINETYIRLNEHVDTKPKLEREIATLNEAQHTSNTKLVGLNKELEELGFDRAKQEALETEYSKRSANLREHAMKIKDKENELSLHKKDIEQLIKTIVELKELETKAEVYKERVMYLSKLAKVFDNFKTYMISRIAPTLTQFASELFRDMTDGRYNRLEVDRDYNVFIYDNGKEFPLERFSGGEEDLANLCLRLAISQVIAIRSGTTGPNFVILDEIFGSQDLNRKRNLLQALNGLTMKFRQIFLITHIEDVKDFIGFNIHVTENDDDTSSIKVID